MCSWSLLPGMCIIKDDFFPQLFIFFPRLDAAVFGFSSSSLFSVNNFAQGSIALGSVASGIGIAIDGWFLLVYSGANAKKFQVNLNCTHQNIYSEPPRNLLVTYTANICSFAYHRVFLLYVCSCQHVP